jgi:hypothetical protein
LISCAKLLRLSRGGTAFKRGPFWLSGRYVIGGWRVHAPKPMRALKGNRL